MMNRLHNCKNPYQGDFKRVLCVCSAGLLRSPTAALVLSQEPYNFNTRACGIDRDHALIALDIVLLTWAEEIVVMNKSMKSDVEHMLSGNYFKGVAPPITMLGIPDSFAYRDPELIKLIKESYNKATGFNA